MIWGISLGLHSKSFLDAKIRIKKEPKPTTTISQTQKRWESQLNFTVKLPKPTSRGVENVVCWTNFIFVKFSGIFWSVEFPSVLDLFFKIMTILEDVCFNFFQEVLLTPTHNKKKKVFFQLMKCFNDILQNIWYQALIPNLNQLGLVASVH